MVLHCDICDKELGTYLFGKGGIEERAVIGKNTPNQLPDIICNECIESGKVKDKTIKGEEEKVSKSYEKKLVELAKELIELDKPIISRQETAKRDLEYRNDQFVYKLNYLLGYIMALEEK